MQALIGREPPPPPTKLSSVEDWKSFTAEADKTAAAELPKLREHFGVSVQPGTIAGVKVFIVTPAAVPDANRRRLLLHVHGGAYVLNAGEAATKEAILTAAYSKMKVISVDYRMPPDHPYPAALDDVLAVWKELIKPGANDPRNMAVFGASAGGGLTLAMVLRAKKEGVALPAAIAPGTPWSDLTKTGDTYFTNETLDNMLIGYDAFIGPAATLYAGRYKLTDPLISPVYGDYDGFPPAILTSGTRDLFLSNTVRVHRKMRAAGVEAELHVFEGQSHGQFGADPDAPETAEYFQEVVRFFEKHLSK
jgi:acetyl esterase/lipase